MKLLLKGGTGDAVSTYKGVSGELIVNTDSDALHIFDGVKKGGYVINRTFHHPGTVSIVAPLNGASEVTLEPVFQSSNYNGTGTHVASFWEISTDSNFTNIVYSSGRDTENLTSLSLETTDFILAIGTTYYIRVKYEGNYAIESPWSTSVYFTSKIITSVQEVNAFTGVQTVSGDAFGYAIAISGDGNYCAVSAGVANIGTVYLFKRFGDTWTQQAKITPADAVAGDQLWVSLALDHNGDTLAIGCSSDYIVSTNNGSVYIYTRSSTTWTQQAKLVAPDIVASQLFGFSTSITADGDTVVIGAIGDSQRGSLAGAAYVFTRSGTIWSYRTKLFGGNITANAGFGYSVSISSEGGYIAIGAYGMDSSRGVVYIFTGSGAAWMQEANIYASDRATSDFYGMKVAITANGNSVIVGARGDDDMGSTSGSAYIHVRNGTIWTQQAKITATNGTSSSVFGAALDITDAGDTVLVGAYGKNSNTGSAYIFTRTETEWVQRKIMIGSNAVAGYNFGFGAVMSGSGSVMLISATQAGIDKGIVYTYM